VYRPQGHKRLPALLQRTPYGRGQWPVTALTIDPLRAAEAGYMVIIQDVRGRGESGGATFYPYRDEFRDGFDSVEWAAALPHCDGRVGAYGVSYMGGAAWHAAAQTPPSLRAIATATTPNDFWVNHLWRGGAFLLGTFLAWSLGVIGPGALLRSRLRSPVLGARITELVDAIDDFDRLVWQRPACALPAARPDDESFLPFFSQTMSRVEPDSFTSQLSVSGRHSQVQVPALILAGWHYFLLQADLDHFGAMRADAATERARCATRLVVGPWSHGSFLSSVGQQDFGLRASGLWRDLREDLTSMHLEWFGRELGEVAVAEPQPPVEVFVQGTNRWRSLDRWPPLATQQQWYLAPAGRLTSQRPLTEHPPDEYTYDPEDPCPTCGGPVLMPRTYLPGPVDQSPILSRPDVLSYTSERLSRPLTVLGPVRAILHCATSGVDTDWVVKLCRVDENGRTVNVCDGILRASFRNGLQRRELVTPGRFERYDISMSATAIVFPAGARLRLLVTSSDFPRYDRNPNTGEPGVRATRSVAARQATGCDSLRPSSLMLGVVDS
jgi:putative CocE/NonD family hydrolase